MTNLLTRRLKSSVAALAVTALAAMPLAIGFTALSTDMAVAAPKDGKGNSGNKGGNGKGNSGEKGGGKPDKDASDDKEPRGQGAEKSAANKGGQRGDIASELKSLNSANANQKALDNANPNSPKGKLAAYQRTGGLTVENIQELNAARVGYGDLAAITEEDKLAGYDADGDGVLSEEEAAAYDQALATAKAALDAAEASYGPAYSALAAMHEGSLTAAALSELNAKLGL